MRIGGQKASRKRKRSAGRRGGQSSGVRRRMQSGAIFAPNLSLAQLALERAKMKELPQVLPLVLLLLLLLLLLQLLITTPYYVRTW